MEYLNLCTFDVIYEINFYGVVGLKLIQVQALQTDKTQGQHLKLPPAVIINATGTLGYSKVSESAKMVAENSKHQPDLSIPQSSVQQPSP